MRRRAADNASYVTSLLAALTRDPAEATRGQRIAGGLLLAAGILALALVPR